MARSEPDATLLKNDDIFAFIEEVKTIEAADHVARELLHVTRNLGFEYAFSSVTPLPGQLLSDATLLNALPVGWLSYYERQELYKADPVAHYVPRCGGSFMWSEATNRRRLTRPERRAIEEARHAGMSDGFVVPVFLHRSIGATSLAGSEIIVPESLRPTLQIMFLFAHSRLMDLKGTKFEHEEIHLTPREKETLTWIAAGKTEDEISELMTITTHTVHKHSDNAKRKLGAATRAAAVAKALKMGLITL